MKAAPKREPVTGFWAGYLNLFLRMVQRNFDLATHYTIRKPVKFLRDALRAIMLQVDIGKSSGINTVYKGVKSGLPYVGKAFNIIKRYNKSQRALMKIQPVLNNIKDSREKNRSRKFGKK